ncbi:MAG: hypothetical protein V4691_03010 [Pseudomonadota bacterium]
MLKYTFAFLLAIGVIGFQPVKVFAEEAKVEASTAMKAETKTKKPLSEKQKLNISTMRACGSEWRAAKAAGQTKGQKWRDYLKECRARKKAEKKA